jgi:ArsR family transcriptional regulator, arsenate/arsenite/antimonite-responsive transcriptional repressor
MGRSETVAALGALAQVSRLGIYQMLVQAGPDGLTAGQIAAALDLSPSILSFHVDRLHGAELVTIRRCGRSMIYAARFDTMGALIGFLTENCCEATQAPPPQSSGMPVGTPLTRQHETSAPATGRPTSRGGNG